MDIELRPLTTRDQDFLWEMLYQAVFVPEGSPQPGREIVHRPELSRYVEGWGRPGDFGLAAIDGNTRIPVGAAWLRLFTAADPGYGYVAGPIPELSAAVLPEQRGRGVGRRLLEQLLAEARLCYPGVSLSVSKDNPAVRLYKQLGFGTAAESEGTLTMLLEFSND